MMDIYKMNCVFQAKSCGLFLSSVRGSCRDMESQVTGNAFGKQRCMPQRLSGTGCVLMSLASNAGRRRADFGQILFAKKPQDNTKHHGRASDVYRYFSELLRRDGAEMLHCTAGHGRLMSGTFDNFIAQASFGLRMCCRTALSTIYALDQVYIDFSVRQAFF
ncbi:MAG TPA: hypothetical protein VIF60_02170 [Burkholderiaceae bacterium]|jgi:hypothetical protein